jgi:hypothetical protein
MLHSGIGYGFMASQKGKLWYYLRDTTRANPHTAGRIYDDMIFHLVGAVRVGEPYSQPSGGLQFPGWGRFMEVVVAVAMFLVPRSVRIFIMKHFGTLIERIVFKPQFILEAQNIQRFMGDPEKYLQLLRKGRQ